jgi:polyhydroxyalkanoate synthase
VFQYPLLIVPPMINKYYITDLAPGRSMAEFLTAQGHQVSLSVAEPDARHRDWDLETYGGAVIGRWPRCGRSPGRPGRASARCAREAS